MRNILSAFEFAAHELGRPLPVGAYVRMWNLLYVCDSSEGSAIELWRKNPRFVEESFADETEKEKAPFVWMAWTASTPAELSERALSRTEPVC